MAKAPTLPNITGQFASSGQLNQAFRDIEDAFENTISRDGSTPNTMNGDLDLNGNSLLNVDTIDVDNLSIAGLTVTDLASVPEWRGTWAGATAYVQNDLVKINGNVYICLTPHVSGTFSTDLSALRWELFVERGAAGAGTGDMVGSNNLSDVTNAATALSNLGGQPLDPFLTDISNLTDPNADRLLFWDDSVGDIGWLTPSTGLSVSGTNITVSGLTLSELSAGVVVTESEGISSNDNDTTIPTSAAVKAYVDGSAGGAPDFILEDQKSSGVNGQTIASAGVWTTKDLNTEVRDVESIVSISSNQFTVTADCWVEWQTMGRDRHMTRLYNVTDATTVATSMTDGPNSNFMSTGGGACVAGKTYRIEVNTATGGQVHVTASGRGVNEVYTRIRGWRT